MKKNTLLATALAAIVCSGATAQPAPSSDSPSAPDETIILSPFHVTAENTEGYIASESITGTRIRADIRDLPFNVNVVTSEFISDFDLIEFEQMLGYTSSYSASEVTPTTLQIRGMPGGNLRNGFVSIGLVARSNLDRIEVIKGPLAAIYGSSQPGGITNMITKRPASRNKQSLNVALGSNDYHRFEASSTGPLTGKLGYRVDLGYWEKDYSQAFRHTEQREYSSVLSYQPKPGTNITMEVERVENYRNRGAAVPWLRDPVTNQYLGKMLDHYYFNTGGPGEDHQGFFIDWVVTTLNASIDHRINEVFSVRASTNAWRRDLTRNNYGNSTVDAATRNFTAGEPVYGVINREAVQLFVDLLAEYSTGSIKHKTLLTFDYRDQDEVVWDRRLSTADVNNPAVNSRIINIDNPVWFYPAFSESKYPRVTADRAGNLKVNGFFLSQRVMLWDDKVQLLAGGRYDKPVNSLADNQTGLRQELPASNFSPQVGANFTVAKPLMLYASYSESYLPQTQVQSSTQALLPNEDGSGTEFGVKLALLDERLNITTAAYFIDRNRILQSVTDDQGLETLEPTGQISSNGFELDFNWQATPALQILGSYGYNDSAITKNPQAPERVGLPQTRVPHHNFSLAAAYRFQQDSLKGLTLRLGVTGQSEALGEYGGGPYVRGGVSYRNDGRSEIYMPGFSVVDLGASYQWRRQGSKYGHRIGLNLKNLLDERYATGNWLPADRFSFSLSYNLSN